MRDESWDEYYRRQEQELISGDGDLPGAEQTLLLTQVADVLALAEAHGVLARQLWAIDSSAVALMTLVDDRPVRAGAIPSRPVLARLAEETLQAKRWVSGAVAPGYANDQVDRYYDAERARAYEERRFDTEKSLVLARSALELLAARLHEGEQPASAAPPTGQ